MQHHGRCFNVWMPFGRPKLLDSSCGKLLARCRARPRRHALQRAQTADFLLPSHMDLQPTARPAPTITTSAPTGDPLSDREPSEFPFDSSAASLRPQPTTNHVLNANSNGNTPTPKASPTSSRPTNHVSTSQPAIVPISRRATAEGDDSDTGPKGRRSVQFARTTTFGTDQNGHSRQQSIDEEAEAKARERERERERDKERDRQGSTLMSKLKALAAPMALQGHTRSQSAYAAPSSLHDGSPRGHLTPAGQRMVASTTA